MVNVQKNHYYRKTVIPTTGAAKLSAVHKDTPLNESNTWTVAGGPSANRFVVSGSVPTDDSHKQGKLEKVITKGLFILKPFYIRWPIQLLCLDSRFVGRFYGSLNSCS